MKEHRNQSISTGSTKGALGKQATELVVQGNSRDSSLKNEVCPRGLVEEVGRDGACTVHGGKATQESIEMFVCHAFTNSRSSKAFSLVRFIF